MNKRTKYSTVIVAALLACAPMAMSTTVKADTQSKITKTTDDQSKQKEQSETDKKASDGSSQQSEISKKASDSTSKQSETGNKVNKPDTKKSDDDEDDDEDYDPLEKEHEKPISDKHITNAKLLTAKWDKSEIKVKWRPDLTSNDLYHYLMILPRKYGHLYANGKEINNYYVNNGKIYLNGIEIKKTSLDRQKIYVNGKKIYLNGIEIKNPFISGGFSQNLYHQVEIKKNSTKLIPKGTTAHLSLGISIGLQPNTWYQWHRKHPYKSYYGFSHDWVKIPKTISDRVSNHILSTKDDLVSVKTDAEGHLPELGDNMHSFESYDYDSNDDPTQSAPKVVVSTDSDALDVPKANAIKPKPVTDNPGFYYYPSTDESDINKLTAEPDKTKNATKNNPTKTSGDNTGNTLDVTSTAKPLMLKHNAFIYTKTGKIARTKYHIYMLWLAYRNVKPLDNGKIYNIKGKEFYRVGKNKYIKVANTTVRPKITKVNIEGTVKAHKGFKRVRLYDVNGKFVKKFVARGKKLRFNGKRKIHNHMYYQIKGTKLWIRASKIKTNK